VRERAVAVGGDPKVEQDHLDSDRHSASLHPLCVSHAHFPGHLPVQDAGQCASPAARVLQVPLGLGVVADAGVLDVRDQLYDLLAEQRTLQKRGSENLLQTTCQKLALENVSVQCAKHSH
jgi:hypothetical protein